MRSAGFGDREWLRTVLSASTTLLIFISSLNDERKVVYLRARTTPRRRRRGARRLASPETRIEVGRRHSRRPDVLNNNGETLFFGARLFHVLDKHSISDIIWVRQ